jgi:hypothetical protein
MATNQQSPSPRPTDFWPASLLIRAQRSPLKPSRWALINEEQARHRAKLEQGPRGHLAAAAEFGASLGLAMSRVTLMQQIQQVAPSYPRAPRGDGKYE